MKYCSSCGSENQDNALFCVNCGTPLEPKTEPTRETAVEHLRFAVDVAGKNLKIFLPTVGFYVGVIVLVIVFGIGYFISSDFSVESSVEAFPAGFMLLFLVLWIGFACVGILSIPFMQNLYYSATVGDEVSFRESLRYAKSRFFAFLGAILVFVVIMFSVAMLWFFILSTKVITSEDLYAFVWSQALLFIFLIPIMVIFTYSMEIMAWDNIGFSTAVRASYNFIRRNLVKLIIIWVIVFIAEIVLMIIPLGALLSFVPNTIMNIAILDAYLHYQRSTNTDLTPTQG